MSWTLSVIPVAKKEFEAAVDVAGIEGQSLDAPGVSEAVSEAKNVLKMFARQMTRPKVGATASGHVLQEGDNDNFSESITAAVYGVS